jgi:hypothetical protein
LGLGTGRRCETGMETMAETMTVRTRREGCCAQQCLGGRRPRESAQLSAEERWEAGAATIRATTIQPEQAPPPVAALQVDVGGGERPISSNAGPTDGEHVNVTFVHTSTATRTEIQCRGRRPAGSDTVGPATSTGYPFV